MDAKRHVAASIRGRPVTGPRLVATATAPAEIHRLVERRLRDDRSTHLRYLTKRLHSPEDAEDVLQEFALKAVRGAGRLADPGKLDAWLGVALRNALFDRYRRNAARTRLREALANESTHGPTNGPEDDINRSLRCLSRALAELPPKTARLLQRAELEETPLATIAGEMQLTANNVGVRVHRARAALRGRMMARCQACQDLCRLSAAAPARDPGRT